MVYEGIAQRAMPSHEGDIIPGSDWGMAIFGFIPGMIYLFNAPVYITMGTSLATMIPLAVVGGGIKLAQGFVDLPTGLVLAAGTIIGAQVGATIIKRIRPATLKFIFGIYFLYVAVKFITSASPLGNHLPHIRADQHGRGENGVGPRHAGLRGLPSVRFSDSRDCAVFDNLSVWVYDNILIF